MRLAIARYAEPDRLAWMHANFTDYSRVAALGDADSYATRLFDYEHSGPNQVTWVIDRLRADPASLPYIKGVLPAGWE